MIGYWLSLVSLISLFPVCLAKKSISSENALKTLIAYQFTGIFLFALGTNSFQYAGIALRIAVLFSSGSFLFIISSISKPMRFLFYFFLLAPIILVESVYQSSLIIKIVMMIAVFVVAIALSFHQFREESKLRGERILQLFDSIFLKCSRACDRALGPIFIEWIFITFMSLLWTMIRFLSRMFSYASLQRHFATSLLILLVILLLVLRP